MAAPISSTASRSRGPAVARPRSGKGAIERILAPLAERPFALLEVVLGMSLILAASAWLYPSDLLLLSLEFPWVWLAATVLALRYGALLGSVAGFVILSAWFIFYGRSGLAEFPLMLFSGAFIQLIVVGHFSDIWAARHKRVQSQHEYLVRRLATLTQNHHLLRISHDRLKQDAFFQREALMDSVVALRSLTGQAGVNVTLALPAAEQLLQCLAAACRFSCASLHALDAGKLNPEPVAAIGEERRVDPANPLLTACLAEKRLCHIRRSDVMQSDYLACAPILDPGGKLRAVLVIRDMAFDALTTPNMQYLMSLLSYYADGLDRQGLINSVKSVHPDCPDDLAVELVRLSKLAAVGCMSCLVAVVLPRTEVARRLARELERESIDPSLVWWQDRGTHYAWVLLQPLTDDIEAFALQLTTRVASADGHCLVHAIEPHSSDHGLGEIIAWCQSHG